MNDASSRSDCFMSVYRYYKGTAGGRAFQFGAASDDQTAADTNKLSGNVSTGAATFSFIQVGGGMLLEIWVFRLTILNLTRLDSPLL